MFTKEVFVQKTRRWENNIYYKMAKSYSMLGKILYAEDDFLTREIVGEKLEEEGYAVVLAKDGKEAWNEFQQKVFDAVILDVDIPVELVVKLKSVLRDNSSRLCYLTEQLSFDTLTNKLFMKGREKVLSTLEGKILAVLCKNPNQLVKKDLLLEIGWNSTDVNWESQLIKTISKLRKLLEECEGINLRNDTRKGYWLLIDSTIKSKNC